MNSFDQLPLKDIHLPDPVSWWPPAVGWWLLLAVVVLTAAVVRLAVRRLAVFRRRRKLNCLLQMEVSRIEREYQSVGDSHRALQQLSVLLRRVSMGMSGRDAVAGLCGQRWIDRLAAAVGPQPGRAECTQLLVEGPYDKNCSVDLSVLFSYLRVWLRAAAAKGFDASRARADSNTGVRK